MAERFYLYERKREGKPSVWYARFRSEDGTIGSPISTGKASRKAAQSWAMDRVMNGTETPAKKLRGQTFEEWAAPWWRFGTCQYTIRIRQFQLHRFYRVYNDAVEGRRDLGKSASS